MADVEGKNVSQAEKKEADGHGVDSDDDDEEEKKTIMLFCSFRLCTRWHVPLFLCLSRSGLHLSHAFEIREWRTKRMRN